MTSDIEPRFNQLIYHLCVSVERLLEKYPDGGTLCGVYKCKDDRIRAGPYASVCLMTSQPVIVYGN